MCKDIMDLYKQIEMIDKKIRTLEKEVKALKSETKNTIHNSEYKSIKNNMWFCERCQKEVDGASVKYEETHENCGGRCY